MTSWHGNIQARGFRLDFDDGNCGCFRTLSEPGDTPSLVASQHNPDFGQNIAVLMGVGALNHLARQALGKIASHFK